jgi:hypothetical protein
LEETALKRFMPDLKQGYNAIRFVIASVSEAIQGPQSKTGLLRRKGSSQ